MIVSLPAAIEPTTEKHYVAEPAAAKPWNKPQLTQNYQPHSQTKKPLVRKKDAKPEAAKPEAAKTKDVEPEAVKGLSWLAGQKSGV